ncbi:T6SS effector amidase Tae4 family protein [Helicobacter fennelliae]|nr:T6SS effector amidase Tae4 family protein [Helicobacter fennelliae]STQ92008.1 Uncharacterised protein [Helicobacter fennelliae]
MSKQLMKTLNLKRPKWESVSKAYIEINEIGKNLNDDYIKSELRYNFLGGKIQRAFEREKTKYVNTCAVRVSYALNYGGMPLKESLISNVKSDRHKVMLQNMKNAIETYNRLDKSNNYYITSSIDMETFLWIKFGSPEIIQKTMTTKQENIIFLNKLKSLNKQGIITMRINFSDAQGHTTLWNKDRFMDSSNYLVEYIIQNNARYYNPVVTEAHFWELK